MGEAFSRAERDLRSECTATAVFVRPEISTHSRGWQGASSRQGPVLASRPLVYPLRMVMIGWANFGSTSQGNRIQVSWLTSVMKVSTTGRPAGLA